MDMLNRHECRLKLIFALYKSLLICQDLKQVFINEYEDDPGLDKFESDFVDNIIADLNSNKQVYIEEIKPYLVEWKFERLQFLEQAILLEAWSEIKTKLNDKVVVIDEAIIIAKEYLDSDKYKFINGVLDNL